MKLWILSVVELGTMVCPTMTADVTLDYNCAIDVFPIIFDASGLRLDIQSVVFFQYEFIHKLCEITLQA